MLRLALYYYTYQLLQPVQQLLAAHGHSIAGLAPLLQQHAAPTSNNEEASAALMQAAQQQMQDLPPQAVASVVQALTAVQQLQQQFVTPVPEDVLRLLEAMCSLPASATPASLAAAAAAAAPAAAAAAAAPVPAAAAAGTVPDAVITMIGSKHAAGSDAGSPPRTAKRLQPTPPPQQQLVLQESATDPRQGHMQQAAPHHHQQQQPQPQQQQQQHPQLQPSLPGSREQGRVQAQSPHGRSQLRERSNSAQLLQGLLQEENSSCGSQEQHAAGGSPAVAAAEAAEAGVAAGVMHGSTAAVAEAEVPPEVALLLAETAAAMKAGHDHHGVQLQPWLAATEHAALADRLGRSAAAAAAFLQSWPQVFKVYTQGPAMCTSGCKIRQRSG
uniref:Uncharacterized protein n=1 Tax=Tetradesmus obliquus TaxID=3088 RepID=A0A383VC70_TETOB